MQQAGEVFGFEVKPMQAILELRNDGRQPERFARVVPCVHERNSAGGSRTGCAGTQSVHLQKMLVAED